MENVRKHIGLSEFDVHVWCAKDAQLDNPRIFQRCLGLLQHHEHEAMARFIFEHSRREYLLTRALCRLVLSCYAQVEPSAWTFAKGPHGKPKIMTPAGMSLQFNLSHTRGMCACAVTARADVGVDLEWCGREVDEQRLAEAVFTSREQVALSQAVPQLRRRLFYTFWTLKEAYVKARGEGFSAGLQNFSLMPGPSGRIELELAESLQDDPKAWSFATLEPSVDHCLALAWRVQNKHRGNVVLRLDPPL